MTSGASNVNNDTGDDVTIPREVAERLARLLRWEAPTTKEERFRLADLLNPPQRSLRDEVEFCLRDTVSQWQSEDFFPQADAVLAVVRKHVKALPTRPLGLDCRVEWMARDDVLALLGGDDE